jgi:hypothetical protein
VEDGTNLERGTQEEMIAVDGAYARPHSAQFVTPWPT